MAQFLDAESGPDFIDITSTTEEEDQGPLQSEQGGAGVSDAEFDPDIFPQPDRMLCRLDENHDCDLGVMDT